MPLKMSKWSTDYILPFDHLIKIKRYAQIRVFFHCTSNDKGFTCLSVCLCCVVTGSRIKLFQHFFCSKWFVSYPEYLAMMSTTFNI